MNKLSSLIIFGIQFAIALSDDNFGMVNVKRDAKLSPASIFVGNLSSDELQFHFSWLVSIEQPEMLKAYGYPAEVHNIVTEDGYILETHRIPKPGKQPVILMHGVLDSSASWVLTGPKCALGKQHHH